MRLRLSPSHPFAALVAFVVFVAACALAPPPTLEAEPAPRVLKLASTDWAPFTAAEGQPRVANELVAEALRADRVTTQEAIVPVEGWLEAIRAGDFDGSAAMWWSEARAAEFLFSEPYLENRLVLVARAGGEVTASSFAELGGARIGIVEGYAYGEELDAARALPEGEAPIFITGADTPANVRALLDEELDYVLADALYARYGVETHPRKQELVVGEAALVTRSLHFAVRREVAEAETLIAQFDARVRQMQRDGSYNQVLGLQWIEVDVDGDGETELVFAGEHAGTEPPEASYRVRSPEDKPKVEVEVQPDYIINGQSYEGWDNVPESYKTPGVGGTNVGIGIRW